MRELLARTGPVLAPGAYDALTGKLIEWAGFDAIFMSGYSTEAGLLGKPDLGFLTMTETTEQAARIANAVRIPVIADADVGYGGPLMVTRAVNAFESGGVAGIMIEDQVPSNRCALARGTQVLPRAEYLAKIKAAVHARRDPDFVLIARVDAYESLGLDEAVARANGAIDLGADLIFLGADVHMEPEDLDAARERIQAPLMGATQSLPGGEVAPTGKAVEQYKILIAPLAVLFTVTRAVMDLLTEFKRNGHLQDSRHRMVGFDEFDDFIGLHETIRRTVDDYGEAAG
jgi:2-methylisocitrate lyase-like PEP mutase family enzyme